MTNSHSRKSHLEKIDWPWEPVQNQVHQAIDTYPKISIITPSFNQGNYLEETIRSIINQNYPNLEYMIFDGGSNDESLKVIKNYEKWITYWESEPDRGQAHAINKGFFKSTGDIIAWINSDDMLLPNALEKVSVAFKENPDKILLGDVVHFYEVQSKIKLMMQKNVSFESVALIPCSKAIWQQPGTFVPAKLFKPDNIFLDESFRYVFDQEWMCKLLQFADLHYLHEPTSVFRVHPFSKTVDEKFNWLPEIKRVHKRYWDQIPNLNKNKVLCQYELINASFSLGVKKWDRRIGQQKLLEAFKLYPWVVLSHKYIEFLMRSFLPYKFIKFIRSLLIRLRLFFPND
jgi:glycosyltransferase involved in cell wall biosynthesis